MLAARLASRAFPMDRLFRWKMRHRLTEQHASTGTKGPCDEAQGSGRDRHRRRPQYRRGDRQAVRRRGRQGRGRRHGQARAASGSRARSRPRAARPKCSSPMSRTSRDVAALVKAVVDRFGRIDILVNNVAISDNKHIFDITEEEWDKVIAVTLKSQFLMGKHVGPADGGAGQRRPHRQYRLDLGLHGQEPRRRLFGRQGRRRQLDARHGGAAGAAQHPGERDRAEQDRLAGRQGRVRSEPAGAQHGQAPGPAGRGRAARCCSW